MYLCILYIGFYGMKYRTSSVFCRFALLFIIVNASMYVYQFDYSAVDLVVYTIHNYSAERKLSIHIKLSLVLN